MPIRSDYVEDVPATPEDVLAVIRDNHRHQCEYDGEADCDIVLSFDSTIRDWRLACDLVPSRELGRAMNKVWEIDRRDDEWQAVLEPAKERRLEDVCRLIAETARIPRVKPARIAGAECAPAAAFLAVRDLLAATGADIDEIAPSTPLAEYTRRFLGTFLRAGGLAPGALPTVTYRPPVVEDIACWTALSLMLLLLASMPVLLYTGWPWPLIAILVVVFAVKSLFAFAGLFLPREVRLGGLVTFRDLAVRLAEHAP
ncbi:MAG TPA: hypothetical protein VF170_19665 [Planctomycetaceae bacterium]